MTYQHLISRRSCLALGLAGAMSGPALAAQTTLKTVGKRVALVIGNANYPKRPLRNPVKDARAMVTSLGGLGYEVMSLENADLGVMLDAMKNFWLQSRDADARVVFYAGHGVVHDGRNYLLPVNAEIKNAADVSSQAADMNANILDKLAEADRGVSIVIVDACRTSSLSSAAARAMPTGLDPVVAPRGTLVAFSTAPGAPALDGRSGNSPYSRHLIEQLKMPGQSIERMFKRVREAVMVETANQQVPWESNSLIGKDFCFRNGPTGLCPTS
jgi:uncharacterized caspase-like protein